MAIQIPENLQKTFEDLKENYRPRFGEILFFDLTKEYYSIAFLKDIEALEYSGLVKKFSGDKKPYAITQFFDKGPRLYFYGVNFLKTWDFAKGKVVKFQKLRATIDTDKVKLEIQQLMSQLSNSKAS